MNKYWIPGPITNYGTTVAGFKGEVRVVEAAEFDRYAHANKVQAEEIQELRARLAEAERTEARLRRGLQFYADGCHCEFGDPTEWDSVSGEPSNFLCDEHGSTIEDGSVARRILEGADIGPDDDGEEVFIDAPRPADSADDVINAQHDETGRTWRGPRSQLPRRYFEITSICCLDYPLCDCNSLPEPDDDWLCFQRPRRRR